MICTCTAGYDCDVCRDHRWRNEGLHETELEVLANILAPARELAIARQAVKELREMRAKLNTPQIADFIEAVQLEAVHQRERWGTEHDAGKRPEDWVTLLAYLLGKAAKAHFDGDAPKLLHHVITTAAVCLNWHANATGASTAMRPGVGPPAVPWAYCEEPASGDGVPACGWNGEAEQCEPFDNGVLRCPSCGSTAIRETEVPRG